MSENGGFEEGVRGAALKFWPGKPGDEALAAPVTHPSTYHTDPARVNEARVEVESVELWPIKKAAKKLGIAEDTLRRAAREGRLGESRKLSERRWLVDIDAARLYVETLPAW